MSNTGPGISAERCRASSTDSFPGAIRRTVAKWDGCGLGLSIVRIDCLAHKGSIRIDSAPAGWTTVKVILPCY